MLILLLLLTLTEYSSAAQEPLTVSEITILDWFSEEASEYIDKQDGIWARGTKATVIDVETGQYFSASRNGGTNHADWEPATKDDTATLKRIYGGEWSWERRPIIVLIGDKAFAASMNGMPHGGNRIKDNGYGGHSCIHFLHSRLHVNDKEDARHQDAVQAAWTTSVNKLNTQIKLYIEVSE